MVVIPAMPELDISEYSDQSTFARDWEDYENPLYGQDEDLQMLWQLLGLLDADELLIHLPEWLAEEKVGFVDGKAPTVFVGRIEDETEKAILVKDSASARSLMKLAHRIDHLQQGLEKVTDDEQRREHLQNRLEEKREEFEKRDDVVELQNEWLPKSQIIHVAHQND